jgi:cystathionine gamma-synthase
MKRMLKYNQALVFYQPKRIAFKSGYFGSLYTIDVFRKNKASQIEMVDLDEEYQEGDLCWLETPVNPAGDSR